MREINFEVRNFLKEQIHSVWQLDLLIAVKAAQKPLDPISLAHILYLPPAAIEFALKQFVQDGLLTEESEKPTLYSFNHHDQDCSLLIEETEKAYLARRIDVIRLIFSAPGKHSHTG